MFKYQHIVDQVIAIGLLIFFYLEYVKHPESFNQTLVNVCFGIVAGSLFGGKASISSQAGMISTSLGSFLKKDKTNEPTTTTTSSTGESEQPRPDNSDTPDKP